MKCRSCGGTFFGEVIDLGLMPLVNNLLAHADDPCDRWPLHVVYCRACSLGQLTQTPPPAAMFEEYLYFSSQSQTMVAHAGTLVDRFVGEGQKVVEIASNDGYLLRQARDRSASVLGVDPAQNIAAHAVRAGVPTRCDYFNAEVAADIARSWGHADVMFANNVLAHVPDPNQIAIGIRKLLAPGGVAHIEVPYVVRMIENCAFDTIYHEHASYFSVSALKSLFNRHDLAVIGVEAIEIHGGSLHLQVATGGEETEAERWCEQERNLGLFDDAFYVHFAARVAALRQDLDRALNSYDQVVGYGAAAKGIVLMNYFGLDASRLEWIVDVSPHKQGRFIPGTRQPVVSPDRLIEVKPDAALLLPWNIQDEIVRRNRRYLEAGGAFIVPIPHVHVIAN